MESLEHLAQEGLPFCLYDGGELTPPTEDAPHGTCIECGTRWSRVYTAECVGCESGFTHLHYPDDIRDPGSGEKPRLTGFAWCDCCGAYMGYAWAAATFEARLALWSAETPDDIRMWVMSPAIDAIEAG